MGKTIREMTLEEGMEKGMEKGMEQGELRGKQDALLRLLRLRFEKILESIEPRIQSAERIDQLEIWLDAFATAEKLSDIPFGI